MAKLADATDLKSVDGNIVWVRFPYPAPKFMTVKELKEELAKYPDDMIIFTNDSEYGAEESGSIEIRKKEWIWRGAEHTIQDVLIIT